MDGMEKLAAGAAKSLHVDEKKMYLVVRTMVVGLAAFLVACAVSLLLGYSMKQAGEIIFIVTGYTAVIAGLGAGIIKVMRK